MFETDSFLGNKKLSLNQNVWRDQRTVPKNRAKQLLAGLPKEALAVQNSGSSKPAQITALNFKA